MQEVTLNQMLDARDKRVDLQKRLLDIYKTPLVCFTMNIAGPIKTSPQIERAFFSGIEMLQRRLPKSRILHKEIECEITGCQAMFCVSMNAQKLKDICTEIEEGCLLCRLFDMDVLDTDGTKLCRDGLRGCIVCGAPGRECAAGRLHSVEQLWAVTNQIITEHFFETDCKQISQFATQSLLDEVYTTPKAGLVDQKNSGSHKDMDLSLFVKSANCLSPYFSRCFEVGHKTKNLSCEQAFNHLRGEGVVAEKIMFETTKGINTHKGAIFSLGALCGALGRLWEVKTPIPPLDSLLLLCSQLVKKGVEQDFCNIDNSTAGGRIYRQYGLKGIRGEVASGFSSVKNISLPIFLKALDNDYSQNDAGAIALVYLISFVGDTTLYNRGGKEGAVFAQQKAKSLIENNYFPSLSEIEQMDAEFIEKNLSPGGCADLLAVTYFIAKLQQKTAI